jgi:hypothetical protein
VGVRGCRYKERYNPPANLRNRRPPEPHSGVRGRQSRQHVGIHGLPSVSNDILPDSMPDFAGTNGNHDGNPQRSRPHADQATPWGPIPTPVRDLGGWGVDGRLPHGSRIAIRSFALFLPSH